MKKIKSFLGFLKESLTDVEPIASKEFNGVVVPFGEGQTIIPSQVKNNIQTELNKILQSMGVNLLNYIKFVKNLPTGKFPPIFRIWVGTSHTGGSDVNAKVAQGREESLRNLLKESISKTYGLRDDLIQKLIISETSYERTSLDDNMFDINKIPPMDWERDAYILVNKVSLKGYNPRALAMIASKLRSAEGGIPGGGSSIIGDDEELVVSIIQSLQTYSDLTTLNDYLQAEGGLESFLNELLDLTSDMGEARRVVEHLNKCARTSGKGNIAKYIPNQGIVIIWK